MFVSQPKSNNFILKDKVKVGLYNVSKTKRKNQDGDSQNYNLDCSG